MIAALLATARELGHGRTRTGTSEGESPAFIRGLALGALVGAAIAGSTWRARARDRASGIAAGENGAVSQATENPESA
ncbi:MAG: hypothetical protein ACAH65_01080 [Chloroflexota bacterium]